MARLIKHTEKKFHSRLTLSAGNRVENTIEFPLNKLYDALWLRIGFTLTVGGTAINYLTVTNPVLAMIKRIELLVSGDGIAVDLPANALYHIAAAKLGVYPRIDNASYDPAAEAAYAMSVSIPLLFADPRMVRPEDTALDASRYTSMKLAVTLGDGSESYIAGVGSGGTFAITSATCDIETECPAGAPADTVRPWFFQQLKHEGSQNVTAGTTVTLERAAERLIKRLYTIATNGGALSRPGAGLASSAIVDTLSVGDSSEFYEFTRKDEQILDENQAAYVRAATAGVYISDFVKDKSNKSALPTGDKSILKVDYTVDGSAPGSYLNMVSVFSETLNRLK